ncbi:MAG TPA: cytochrome c peroxidase, partial [Chryseolinea sp.]|nr:cytochrome c peroxidase [Chryseolinea sp.]
IYTFSSNPVTEAGFELGRALFYDPILSSDSTIACANCHQQGKSFSDPVHRFSKGVNDASGFRNAPAIQNMAFQDHFFWDGGANHLDFVSINAITSEIEMNESLEHAVKKLKQSNAYRARFKSAFNADEVTSQKMLFALSQFMNMMVSANSRYDRYVRREGVELNAEENLGMTLFKIKCAGCHATDLFSDGSFRNNGLDVSGTNDHGRERITEFEGDRHKFKVPSLRNVALTFPYMHDGRFLSLESVLKHYQVGVVDSETLDPLLRTNDAPGISITEEEKVNIIAFLKTLTDVEFIQDQRFTDPFNH